MSSLSTAHVLVEALPYIRRFAGKTVVVKFGGNAIAGTSDHDALSLFAEDIVLMHTVGIRPVVVHGGGPQINDMLTRLNIESSFSNGLRVTDAATMEVVQMVLNGQVNPQIVSAINTHGNVAVGLSGEDGRTLQCVARDASLGFVGDIERVRTHVIEGLLADGLVPVLSTVGVDVHGQPYNVNADTAAGAIAEALSAEKIIYLTDIAGLRKDIDDASSLIQCISVMDLGALIADGTISGGMIPKIESCMQAVKGGVKSAHILDGRIAHVLLLELFTDQGVGTMITGVN
ncbi:MAG: acetylglutamate kinase [Actinobacteria bacterium]|nr:acetylglutamate kinase [Actinomycetota bacterium]